MVDQEEGGTITFLLLEFLMENGNSFRVFTADSAAYLADRTVADYYAEPLPAATDEKLDEMVIRFMAATAAEREFFQAALSPAQRSLFGIYGHRAATTAVRSHSRDHLLRGLVGAAIANYTIPDRRNVEVALAVYYHCAGRLDWHTVDLFEAAADYAGGEIVGELLAYGRRSDITLQKFGWREVKSPDGIRYKFG
ncbi:MAG: hypothetical protein KBE23_23820 [Chloroflexi bacterium]|nr:hypothetical protein [Chloroflexota bacterium]MBP7045798.1 hypothetical protein [Chloroflexota bacterium]